MRYAELLSAGRAWRVTSITPDLDFTPEGNPEVVRYAPITGALPALHAKYDEATQTFVDDGWTPPPITPELPTRMSKLAFQSRYTLAEQVAIEAAAQATGGPLNATQRATLRVLERALQSANDVDLTDPRTVQGVQTHAALGLLTPQRAAQILDPNWVPTP